MLKKKLSLPGFFSLWLPVLLVWLQPAPVLSQTEIGDLFLSREKLADKLYERGRFPEAIKLYDKARQRRPDKVSLMVKAANCHYKLHESEKALELYVKARSFSHAFDKESLHNFYMALNNAGHYREAQSLLSSEMDRPPADLFKDSANYKLEKASINSGHSDFGAVFYDFGIVFLSSRPQTGLIKKIDAATRNDFYDLYYSRIGEDGRLLELENFSDRIDTTAPYHFGSCAFYDSDRKMIFAMNAEPKGEAVSPTKLFMAEKNAQGKWRVTGSLFPDKKGSFDQPFVDEKNDRLFFVTDALDGYGGADIYFCSLSDPNDIRNAGPVINTPGNDLFPGIYRDSLFFFSTNARPGLGGLDIFMAGYSAGEFSNVRNMGYPVNSDKDDFALSIDKYGRFGFLSSNRDNENGSDEIYKVIFRIPPEEF